MNLPTPDKCPIDNSPDPRGEMRYLSWVTSYLGSNIEEFFKKRAIKDQTTQMMVLGRRHQANWYSQLISTDEFQNASIFAMNQRMESTGWQITETKVQWFKNRNPVRYQAHWEEWPTYEMPQLGYRPDNKYRQTLILTFEYTAPHPETKTKE